MGVPHISGFLSAPSQKDHRVFLFLFLFLNIVTRGGGVMQKGKKEEGRRVPVCLHMISCCVGQGDSSEDIFWQLFSLF